MHPEQLRTEALALIQRGSHHSRNENALRYYARATALAALATAITQREAGESPYED